MDIDLIATFTYIEIWLMEGLKIMIYKGLDYISVNVNFFANNRKDITVQWELLPVGRNLLPRFVHYKDDLDNEEQNVNNCENASDFAQRKRKERKDRKESKERKEMWGGDTPAPTNDFLDDIFSALDGAERRGL